MKVYTEKDEIIENPDDDEAGLYLIHHMHHIKHGNKIEHELHHCQLFSKKAMRGQQYEIIHRLNNDEVVHYVDKDYSGKLYDHVGNVYAIKDSQILRNI